MQLQEYTLVLTGAHNKRTAILNRVQFINGVGKVRIYPTELDMFLRYMGRSFKAFLAGSSELQEAQTQDEAHGIQRNLQANSAQTNGASASVQGASDSGAGPVSGSGALPDSGIDADKAGSQGMVSGGPRHENAGLGEGMDAREDFESAALIVQIRNVVLALDFSVLDQWNETGLPSVQTVCEALHNQSITREMIDIACPGYNRHTAEDLQSL